MGFSLLKAFTPSVQKPASNPMLPLAADFPRAADHASTSGVDETASCCGCSWCFQELAKPHCTNQNHGARAEWQRIFATACAKPATQLAWQLPCQEVTMAVAKAAKVSLWEDAVWLLEASGVQLCLARSADASSARRESSGRCKELLPTETPESHKQSQVQVISGNT